MKEPSLWSSLMGFAVALASRVLIVPLTWLVPRSSTRWVVIGRDHGKFLDNAKHFFCWLHQNKRSTHRIAFITEHSGTVDELRSREAEVLRYPLPPSLWALLRASTVIVDSVDYLNHGRVGFLSGARVIQLWHGAPLKEIELPLHKHRLGRLPAVQRAVLRTLKAITGRYRETAFLIATSDHFAREAFSKCFRARQIISTGYPRNDAMAGRGSESHGLLGVNVDQTARMRILHARAQGRKVVLYSPTFRMDRRSPFRNGGVDLLSWAHAAAEHGYLLVLKLHPLMSGLYQSVDSHAVVDVAADSDIYPLLREVDVMVTDYSSIYFDFLLLDRPILFFAYDLDHYAATDRRLLFDYSSITPGPKLANFEALLVAIPEALRKPENWAGDRNRIRNLVFDDTDANASQRIWDALQNDANNNTH